MSHYTESAPRWMRCGWLPVAVIGLALAVAGAGGCKRATLEAGGANTSKAKEARKQAEVYAAEAVQGAVAAEVDAHPEMAKKKGGGWLAGLNPFRKSPAPVSAPPPQIVQAAPQSPTVPVLTPITPAAPPTLPKPTPPSRPVIAQRQAASTARPSGAVVIRERVVSDIPYPTEAEAEKATLEQAGEQISQKLRELDPPIEYRPSAAVVKNDYLRADTRVVRSPTEREKELIISSGYHPDRMYVEYTVEITADQIRELRIQERVGSALRLFGAVMAIALAGFLFLRLDEWSKGYLTSWLAVIAVALVGGAGIALILV